MSWSSMKKRSCNNALCHRRRTRTLRYAYTACGRKLPQDAELIFVGDLADRGSQSAEVVKFVRDGGYQCVIGNQFYQLYQRNYISGFKSKNIYNWLPIGHQGQKYNKYGVNKTSIKWMIVKHESGGSSGTRTLDRPVMSREL